jgi:hypothetical protein
MHLLVPSWKWHMYLGTCIAVVGLPNYKKPFFLPDRCSTGEASSASKA